MSTLSVSNISVQAGLTSVLQSEQTTLTQLTAQLSSGKLHTDLTDYSASDAMNLINLQSTATQRQAYQNVIATVSNNLSIYDTTMTDLESITSQAQSLANDNPNYSASTASNLAVQATNFLRSVSVDLNQEVNGRYIYAGTRYTTPPSADLSTLSATTNPLPTAANNYTTATSGNEVPSYDVAYAASSLSMSVGSTTTATVSGTASPPQTASVIVNGTTYSYTVTATDTPTSVATGLAAVVNAAVPGIASNSGTSTLTVTAGNTISYASAFVPNSAAYTKDAATVDTNYTVNYGISSNDPAMQQLVAGLRYLQAAGNSTDATTYATNIHNAAAALSLALPSLENEHTTVAYNINTMTSEKAAQTKAISSLTDQVYNIQQVDVTQVSTEITSLETVLQASYSATGSIMKMSIVSYL